MSQYQDGAPRSPGPRPAPSPHGHLAPRLGSPPRPAADHMVRLPARLGHWTDGLLDSPSSQRTFGLPPVADQFFRMATDPYHGRTYKSRYTTSIGCAGALLYELLHTSVTIDGGDRTAIRVAPDDAGRYRVWPDHFVYRDQPPHDSLLHRVLEEVVDDARERTPRPVREVVQFLAEDAYLRVGERLVRDRMMIESTRRVWPTGRTQRVWVAPESEKTSSINMLVRLPRLVRDRKAATLDDRFLFGLVDVVDLRDVVIRECGTKPKPARHAKNTRPVGVDDWVWPSPESLRLPEPEAAIVAAVEHVRAAAARGYGR